MISIDEKPEQYKKGFEEYKIFVDRYRNSSGYSHSAESAFESMKDWSVFYEIEEVKQWFEEKRNNASIQVLDIPLLETKNWFIDKDTGNIYHQSNDFFTIHGIRVTTDSREVGTGGWDQPIIEQVGYDGGLLGLIRKRFNGIPHYLCEAKMEPGNYGKIQLSPTLQATFANLNRAHGGKKPHYSDYFQNTSNYKHFNILFDAWLAEDGGRLYLKRNRGILLEIPEDFSIEKANDNFIWLSLYQIKTLLKEDAWINPHIRGILAHV